MCFLFYAGHQASQERGPIRQRRDLHVFVQCVGAVTDGAKSV
jgi:hypothetical protein